MPVIWHGGEVTQKLRGILAIRLEKAARLLRSHIRTRSSRSQPIRGTGTRARGLDPSKPGEYPKKVIGMFRRSIAFEMDRKNLIARVGSNLKYARFLELGTRKMRPRPWLRLGIAETLGQMKEIMKG